MVVQSFGGKYGGRLDDAWGWLLPTIMPTLALIVGVLVVDLGTDAGADKMVDRYLFRLALGLSVVYLFLVTMTFLAQPLTGVPTLDLMQRSNLWLGPLQGLVAATLGAFFLKGEGT